MKKRILPFLLALVLFFGVVPLPTRAAGDVVYVTIADMGEMQIVRYPVTLEDKNGNVVCTYIERNRSVSALRYDAKEDTVLPITVISLREYQIASRQSILINTAYCALYPIEVLAVLLIYFKKRTK